MKKFFVILMVALTGVFLASCEYDDEPLWTELEQLKDRVKTLEEVVERGPKPRMILDLGHY